MNNSLFDVLLRSVKSRFPQLNWKLGSMIRTLLLEPLTFIGDEVSAYVDAITKASDISTILNDPYKYEAELDKWIAKLNISLPTPTAATGTLTLIKNDNEPLTIAAGTDFYWDSNTHVYAVDRLSYGSDGTPYIEIAPEVYAMEVPVQTSGSGTTFLSTGTAMNWDNAPSSIQDIYVQSPIGGGVVVDATLKAALISARLRTPVLMGIDSIKSALIQQFNNVICDAVVGDKQFVGGSCTLPIYLKQNYQPTEESINLSDKDISVSTVDDKNVLNIRIDTEGVLLIREVSTSNGILIPCNNGEQFGELGTAGSYCVITTDQFSDPYTLIKHSSISVKRLCFSGSMVACDWLNDSQRGLPYQVRGMLPAYGEVKMQINTGGVTIPRAALNSICNLVNSSALNQNIADAQVKEILAAYGITVSSAILYIATLHHKGSTITTTQSGSLSVYGLLGLGGVPCALYCSINDIKSY